MTATCLRCDWEGATDAAACPRCGAPLFRPAGHGRERSERRLPDSTRPPEEPLASERPERPGAEAPGPDDGPLEPARPVTSPRSVFVVVGVAFAMIVLLLSQGGSEPEPRRTAPSPSARSPFGGVLVYTVEERGDARIYRWDLEADAVERGPLIPAPETIVNVRSPGYGWLGLTSHVGNGIHEASVLDSLEPGAAPDPLGRGDVVTWARQGATVVLVDRGPLLDSCRRRVSVEAVHIGVQGREDVLRRTLCGDVLTAGRTSTGYFLTLQVPEGIDVVGAGYADAGTLLADHGVIAISPAGDMLVTPSSEFAPAVVAPRPARAEIDPPPISVSGAAAYYAQFGGEPVPYEVSGVPLRVDRVVAYAPGAATALVVGRLGGERPGLWEVPLSAPGQGETAPRYVAAIHGPTAAAYANDGTAYVVTDGGVWRLLDHRLTPLDLPDAAPVPTGPIAWIVREPFVDL